MDELEVVLSPSSVPCSSPGSATDPVANPPQIVSLELSVVNTSQSPVDLSNAMLRFAFPIDPGGAGSEAALVLAQPGQPGVPWQAVNADPLTGTPWNIDPAGACLFDAYPQPATGSAQPGVLAGQGQGSVTFLFSQIAAATVPGVAPITVTLVGAPGISVKQMPSIQKSQAGFGITSFAASPLLVGSGEQSGLTWTVVGATDCTLTWEPPYNATVTVGQNPVTNGQFVPSETGASPYQATLTGDTDFILQAHGPYTVISNVVVQVARPLLRTEPFPCEVVPYGSFTLTWEDAGAQNPVLSWYPPDGANVYLEGNNLTNGYPVPNSGVAAVILLRSANFLLTTAEGQSAAAAATVKPVIMMNVTTTPIQEGSTTGRQYVGLNWMVDYATSLDILEQAGSSTAWAPIVHIGYPLVTELDSYEDLPLSDVTTFRLVANGEPAPLYLDTYPVTPFSAQITSFTCILAAVSGEPASLMWQTVYCTGISLSADMMFSGWDEWGTQTVTFSHENLLQAGPPTGYLYWTFPPDIYYQGLYLDNSAARATLVASGFESASYSLRLWGWYYQSAIGVPNIRDADTPRGGSVSQ